MHTLCQTEDPAVDFADFSFDDDRARAGDEVVKLYLAYWDVARRAWTVEPGRVELMVGGSSAEGDLALRRTVAVSR